MPQAMLPRPADYIQGYSPNNRAELLLHIVDERPKPGLRPLARRARSALRLFLTGRDANDVEAAMKIVEGTARSMGLTVSG